ncbi:hypothetical protein GCM10022243_63660 [Saccharothrix violaceirubra]|uniref:Uncharacterized protein n=1 Tax=Saccharothrix violaceirubra TaxID=413306 RepID=A0A7W7SZX4_9PSEU|nr:hypothetical protein [Saccharothrix violaceirubra]MBB4962700.1 hypothetical protein [Saccharothrix violaceirubra]
MTEPDPPVRSGDDQGPPEPTIEGLSLSAIEADLDALMAAKMTELDDMLAGLEDLVVRLEGEITELERPDDDTSTP